jgi:hypothetical protein
MTLGSAYAHISLPLVAAWLPVAPGLHHQIKKRLLLAPMEVPVGLLLARIFIPRPVITIPLGYVAPSGQA